MKISTKARYGLRALVDLAVHSTGEQIPLVYIADRQKLSVSYLEQVFSLLKKSGVVKSIKGAQGGYMLARQARDITVGEVIRAIEGDIFIIDHEEQRENESPILMNMRQCLKQQVWDKMNESINEVIDHITLEDLTKEYQVLNQNDVFMYYI